PTRVFLRDTRTYVNIARAQCRMDRLADSRLWSEGLGVLSRAYARAPAIRWPRLLEEERRALQLFDVPAFRMVNTGRALQLPDGSEIEQFTHATGYERVAHRLSSLCERDLREQLDRLLALRPH